MIIKKSSETPLEKSVLEIAKKIFKDFKWLIIVLSFLIYTVGMFLFGGISQKSGFFGQVIVPIVESNIRIPGNYLKGLFTTVEHIELDVKHKNFMKLYYKRQQALAEGVLHSSKKDMVPARIRWRNKNVKIRMRLKGDLGDHWADDTKWSFRVKTSRDETVMGMSKFSLQHPRTRGFLNDWFLHRFLDHMGGFIVLRYDFVDVSINGKELGIYLLEEHFDDKLVENNGFENSPIIRIYDHLLWYNIDPVIGFQKDHLNENYTFSPIDAFNTGTVKRDPLLLKRFKVGKNLLEAFRRKKLKTHEVFNVTQLAKLFAIIDLFGYHHSTAFSNIRFYYNPSTSKLDPIGYDNTFIYQAQALQGQSKSFKDLYGERNHYIDYNRIQIWYNTFFEDSVFFKEYVKQLDKISKKEFLDDFLKDVEPEYHAQLNKIYKSFPGYKFKKIPVFYGNQQFIYNMIHPQSAVQAYTYKILKTKKQVILNIANVQEMLLRIKNVSYKKNPLKIISGETILNPKIPFDFLTFGKMNIQLPDSVNMDKFIPDSLRVEYSVYGLDDHLTVNVFPWDYLDEDYLKDDPMRMKENVSLFPFIKKDEHEKSIRILKGKWEIDKPLVIPAGYTVLAGAGTKIRLTKDGKIISYSPIQFVGSEQKPIKLSGEAKPGQGILILNTDRKSIFENVIFEKLSPVQHGEWALQSAVSFFRAEAIFNLCEFEHMYGPTALRFNKSSGIVRNSVFKNNTGNGIDIFSSKVDLENVRVDSLNGFGIKYTNSQGEVTKLVAKNLKDEAFHTCDRSRVHGSKFIISNCKTAVTVLNSSKFTGENIQLNNCDIGFNLSKTKTEFDGAKLFVQGVTSTQIKNMYKKDKYSVIY